MFHERRNKKYANFQLALTISSTVKSSFSSARPGLCLLLFSECIHIINSLRGRQEELIINYNNEMEHGIACLKKLLSLFTIFLLLRLFSLIACIVSFKFFFGAPRAGVVVFVAAVQDKHECSVEIFQV